MGCASIGGFWLGIQLFIDTAAGALPIRVPEPSTASGSGGFSFPEPWKENTISIRVGIEGISGFGGGEALRLIANHPSFELVYAAGEGSAGSQLIDRFPGVPRKLGGPIP